MPGKQASNLDSGASRRVWPFFSAPLRVFAAVLGPIASMMLLLAVLPGIPWALRLTAGAVVAVSLYAFCRGYVHRVEATDEGISYLRPGRCLHLHWEEVRDIGRYVPLDRNQTSQYVYITKLNSRPVDWREIDENTIQLQDRPGLLESLQERWAAWASRARVEGRLPDGLTARSPLAATGGGQ